MVDSNYLAMTMKNYQDPFRRSNVTDVRNSFYLS